jgi:hypothetical protein
MYLPLSFRQTHALRLISKPLCSGVTTIRNPGGPTNESVHLRNEVLNGNLSGPEIFTAGRLLNTPEFLVPFVEKQLPLMKMLEKKFVDKQKQV